MEVSSAMQSPRLIWQQPGWPALHYDAAAIGMQLALARRAQGLFEGKLTAIGVEQHQSLAAEAWTQDAISTAAIEGERLDLETVRSSVARRLGLVQVQASASARHVDGLLDVMDDAVTRAQDRLTHPRVQSWQAALFPTGFSGMTRIRVGGYRDHAEPMQIVSARIGRETVHYRAPPSAAVPGEMEQFLAWLDGPAQVDSLVKAALAHLWFETIHSFEDGNGRVGRAIVDLVLARDSGGSSRLLRISQQLLARRREYYEELERAQRGPLDVTAWVVWFVAQVRDASAARPRSSTCRWPRRPSGTSTVTGTCMPASARPSMPCSTPARAALPAA